MRKQECGRGRRRPGRPKLQLSSQLKSDLRRAYRTFGSVRAVEAAFDGLVSKSTLHRWLSHAGVLGTSKREVVEAVIAREVRPPAPPPLAPPPAEADAEAPLLPCLTSEEAQEELLHAAAAARRELASWRSLLGPAEAAECYYARQAGFSYKDLALLYGVDDWRVVKRAVERIAASREEFATGDDDALHAAKLRSLLELERSKARPATKPRRERKKP